MSLEIQQREREGITVLDLKGRITRGPGSHRAAREGRRAGGRRIERNLVLQPGRRGLHR